MLIKNGTIHDGLGFAGQRDLRIESGLITGLGESLHRCDAVGAHLLVGDSPTIEGVKGIQIWCDGVAALIIVA